MTILIKDIINDKKALTEEQGQMLFDKMNEEYQRILNQKIRIREVIEVSFKDIEEVSLEFISTAFSNFKPEEIVNYFVLKDIETKEIMKRLKLVLSNMIMLSE